MRGVAIGAAALGFAAPAASTAPAISISELPTVVTATNAVQLYGRISSGRPGESVQIEMSECGGYGWRVLTHAETTSFGAWNASAGPTVTTKFRARWHNATSEVVTVRARPYILLDNHHHRRLLVIVRANDYFARALLQRRAGAGWVRVRSVALGHSFQGSVADLRLRLPRGTRIRIVVTQAQVGRCYLPAAATTVVT
jgi:hypothetical protein